MKLTEMQIKNAKPREKLYALSDGNGLSLEVTPKGSKRWRVRYHFGGKAKRLSVGIYPYVGLKKARDRRDEIFALVAAGVDPSEERKKTKRKIEESSNTFRAVAGRYFDHYRPFRAEHYWTRMEQAFAKNIYPSIGERPLSDISALEIIPAIQAIQERGSVETAGRILAQISRVFKFGVANGICERNPVADIDRSMILKPTRPVSYPTITDPVEIGQLLRDIDRYTGHYTVKMALSFAPFVAVRPGNLRLAEWSEIDWEERLWRISAEKMKSSRDHLVPLSTQAMAILEEMRRFSGDRRLIFPSQLHPNSPMSNVTMTKALRKMGYGGERMVPHGFRAMFSTIAHEKSGFAPEIIETQLAHTIGTKVTRAYNRALYLDDRRRLMQWWGDWLERAKNS